MATVNKYLDYAGLQHFAAKLEEKYAPIAALLFKSSVEDIAHLPALNTVQAGWMYNITAGGITTADFVEGAGHLVTDGENVAAVELITGYAAVGTVTVNDDPKALGWYEVDAVSYTDVTATLQPTDDPSALGLYEFDGTNYTLTADNAPQAGKSYFEKVTTYKLSQDRIADLTKSYFTAVTVMKWDLMGGVFDLEDRYLEFGNEFPKNPEDGRTFLYMGADTKVYTAVDTPSGRPADNGYFEGVFTAVADQTTIKNPKEEGLYEQDSSGALTKYVHSADITRDSSKTYYSGVFTPSADTTVDPTKVYYTEEDQYRKTVIYKYDNTTQDWVAQSSSGTGDMVPITNAEIDELFI